MADAREFTVETSDGARLRGTRHGREGAPVAVLSNSLGTTRALWDPQVAALSDRFSILTYDTRGHGASDAPPGDYSLDRLALDVLEIMDARGVERAHFAGVSLGGMTGQVLGVRAPDRLRSLTLAATSAYMGPPENWQGRIETVRGEGMDPVADRVGDVWFSEHGHADAAVREACVKACRACDPGGYGGCCAAIRDMDLRGAARAIAAPTLVIAGADDPATPPPHAEYLAGTIPGAELKVFRGAHLINLDAADAVTDALRTFWSAH